MFVLATAVSMAGIQPTAFCVGDDDPMTAPDGAQNAPPAAPKAKRPPRGDGGNGGTLAGPKVPDDAGKGDSSFGPKEGKNGKAGQRQQMQGGMMDARLFMESMKSVEPTLSDDQRTKVDGIRQTFMTEMTAWRETNGDGAFKQLALQTEWGALDYLIVDLPPGTGDVPLTLAQLLPLTGAVVVCTPQRVAQDDARRAVRMFQQLDVPVLGVVENMSYFIGDDGKTYDIFGRGGAEIMARTMDLPYLGAIPIHMDLRRNSDEGTPLENWRGNPTLAGELDGVCQRVASRISIITVAGGLIQPTLSVTG